MIKRILTLMIAALLLSTVTVFAATADELNDPGVFLKQSQRGTCTLASTAMMLRRTAMLRGDETWSEITESSCRQAFWLSGRGLPYQFSYDGITVERQKLPGGTANRQVLIDLLAAHPEGVVLHAASVPHAVLLTDYTDGVFYCADPAENIALARVPITEAYGTRIENSSAYWSVTSPDVALEVEVEMPEEAAPSLPENAAVDNRPLHLFPTPMNPVEAPMAAFFSGVLAAQAKA